MGVLHAVNARISIINRACPARFLSKSHKVRWGVLKVMTVTREGGGVRQTPQIDIEGFIDASRSSPADVDQITSKDDHLGVVLRAITARRKSGGVGIAAYILCADFFQTIIGGRSHHGFVGDDAGGIS